MYAIVVYDAGDRRSAKAHKICQKYLTHVQKSVFEGMITPAKLKQLENELMNILNDHTDACCIYTLESTKYCRKHIFGHSPAQSLDALFSRSC